MLVRVADMMRCSNTRQRENSYTYTFHAPATIHFQWPYNAQQTFGASTASKIDRSTRHPAAQNSAREIPSCNQRQRLICNRGLIKLPRLGSGAHVRYPEAGSSRSPPRPRLSKLEPPKQCITVCLATTAVTSPRSQPVNTRSAVLSCAHATSFLFHSSAFSLQGSTPPTPCLQACPFRTEHSTHHTLLEGKTTKRRQVQSPIHASADHPAAKREALPFACKMHCADPRKEPHNASSSLVDEPGPGCLTRDRHAAQCLPERHICTLDIGDKKQVAQRERPLRFAKSVVLLGWTVIR